MSQLFAVMMDGEESVQSVHHEEGAVRRARLMARQTGRRVNVFKLIQTHTYDPSRCHSCGEVKVDG